MSLLVKGATDLGPVNFQAIYPGTSQNINSTATSAQSAAMGAYTSIVQVSCNQDCFLAFGTNPTATTTAGMFLPLNQVCIYGVQPGSIIAVVRSSADGVLRITEGL